MRRPLASLIILALLGCASGQGNSLPDGVTRDRKIFKANSSEYDVTTFRVPDIASRAVPVPLDRAWAALPAAYEKLGLSLRTVNAASHLAGTGYVTVRNSLAGTQLTKYLNCGYSAMGMPNIVGHTVHLRVRTQLSATADGGTLVRTLVEATARDDGTSTEPIECSTTGALERRVAERLANSPA